MSMFCVSKVCRYTYTICCCFSTSTRRSEPGVAVQYGGREFKSISFWLPLLRLIPGFLLALVGFLPQNTASRHVLVCEIFVSRRKTPIKQFRQNKSNNYNVGFMASQTHTLYRWWRSTCTAGAWHAQLSQQIIPNTTYNGPVFPACGSDQARWQYCRKFAIWDSLVYQYLQGRFQEPVYLSSTYLLVSQNWLFFNFNCTKNTSQGHRLFSRLNQITALRFVGAWRQRTWSWAIAIIAQTVLRTLFAITHIWGRKDWAPASKPLLEYRVLDRIRARSNPGESEGFKNGTRCFLACRSG